MAAKITPLSEMLAKRRETLGSETRFEWPVDDDKSFWVLDPKLATDEWRDEFAQLQQDFQDGKVLPSDFHRTAIEMLLDEGDDTEQSDDYIAMFDGFPSPIQAASDLLMETMRSWTEQTDPTRQSSRSTRRNVKRR